MRHVDEGTIHAWLDRQIADPADAARIEEHLRGCSACRQRLAEERAAFDGADALLASVAPVADASREAFDAIAARASEAPAPAAATVRPFPSRFRVPVIAAGWAASLALAAALGWAVRDVAPVETSSRDAERSMAQLEDRSDAQGRIESAIEGSPAAGAPAARKIDAPADPASRGTGAPETDQSRALSQQAGPQRVEGAAAPRDSAGALPAAAPAPPSSRLERQPRQEQPPARTLDQLVRRPAEPSSELADQAVPQSSSAPDESSAAAAASPSVDSLETRNLGTLPPPPAPTPPAAIEPSSQAGGRRGVGGRGGRGGGPAAETFTASVGNAAGSSWPAVPRTQAAAASGMPLYGIAGLAPLDTRLSADRSIVQTTYRTESGATVVVTQERLAPPVPLARTLGERAAAGEPAGAAQTPDVDVQSARQATGAEWSTVRDGIRVTLRGDGNLEALGKRLRLD